MSGNRDEVHSAVITAEDTAHVFALGAFGFTDVEGDPLQSVTISNLSLAGGTLTHTGGTVTVTNGMTITAAQLADLTFTPATDSTAPASFDYAVNDADPGAVTAAMGITVTPVNDAPVATGGAVITAEDTAHVFALGAFGFTDVEDDPLQSVTISNLSLAGGTLTHTGGAVTVTNGMTITAAQLADLTFIPAANSTAPASFDYAVNDADPGAVTAAMGITVTAVNDAPVATGGAVITAEDTAHVFALGAFGFTDVEGDPLSSITVSNLSLVGGTLTHTGGTVTVTNGMTITAAQLADLTFTPAANSTAPASFDYAVNDADPGAVTAAMGITVTAVNDAPVATGGAVITAEDTAHVFALGAFGFTDVEGDPLSSITVSNLSLAGGTLTHTGGTVTVTNGMTITAAQLADLTFTPAANSTAPASFDYAVNDADPGAVTAAMGITIGNPSGSTGTTGGSTSTTPPSGGTGGTSTDPTDPPDTDPDAEDTPGEEVSGTPIDLTTTSTAPSPSAAPNLVLADLSKFGANVPANVASGVAQSGASDADLDLKSDSNLGDKLGEGLNIENIDLSAFSQNLTQTAREIRRQDNPLETVATKVTFAFGSLLTVGGASFVLRGGAIAAALFSAMPAWSRFDPIAIVTGKEDDSDEKQISVAEEMLMAVQEAGRKATRGSSQ